MSDSYQLAKNVLDYWFTIEFLSQDNYPSLSLENRKSIAGAKRGNSKIKKQSNFLLFDKENVKEIFDAISRETKACGMLYTSNLTFYLGKIKRESCIQSIIKSLGVEDIRPEKNVNDIACVSFQLTTDRKYIEKTLSLSPIIWALNEIKNTNSRVSSTIHKTEYENDIKVLEKNFFDENCIYKPDNKTAAIPDDVDIVSIDDLKKIVRIISELYLVGNIGNQEVEENYQEVFGVSFDMYKDTDAKEKTDEDDYHGLCNDYFSDDIKMLFNQIETKHITNTKMGVALLDYICEPKAKKHNSARKIDLTHPDDFNEFEEQVYDIFDIRNAPLGKWPSRYSPTFMQQVAINLQTARRKNKYSVNGTIFSVNGPPGTGKTTLLKEIIVNNIVERAKLLAEYDNPNDAFIAYHFLKGDKPGNAYSKYIPKWYSIKDDRINNFSVLVASCNNAAVENISKELPLFSDIYKNLQPNKNDTAEYAASLKEVEKLFNPNETGKNEIEKEEISDIYFTKYAKTLLKTDDAWGLITAALGKKSNIKSYYKSLLSPLIFSGLYYKKEDADDRLEEYQAAKNKFRDQLAVVKGIEAELGTLCDNAVNIRVAKQFELKTIKTNEEAIANLMANIESMENKEKNILDQLALSEQILKKITDIQAKTEVRCQKADDAVAEKRKEVDEFLCKEFDARKSTGLFTRIFNKKKYLTAMQIADNYAIKKCGAQSELEALDDEQQIIMHKLQLAEHSKTEAEKVYKRITEELSLCRSKANAARAKIKVLEQEIKDSKDNFKNKVDKYKDTLSAITARENMNSPCIIDRSFVEKLIDNDTNNSTNAQVSNPWTTKRYDIERIKLFNYAIRMNKSFVLSTTKCRDNIKTLSQYWGLLLGDDKERVKFHTSDKEAFVGALYQTLFLFTPVISSTFASVSRLFKDVKSPGMIGTLIVDEAGQAQPQMALGAMFRSRKAMVVGDPKQIEPVVSDDLMLLKKSFNDEDIKPYSSDKTISVQGFADAINAFGTFLSNSGQDEDTWVGCPLVVHRRCISPMYDISNELSYNGIMKQQTMQPKAEDVKTFVFEESRWINVKGREQGKRRHYVLEQGEKVCEILDIAFSKSDNPNLYIISPFTTVVSGVKDTIKSHFQKRNIDVSKWVNSNIGTVHKFQGKEANEVIFLLGCDTSNDSKGAITWVNTNIVNVAVTRAKYRLYIIGDIAAWKYSLCVSTAKEGMDKSAKTHIKS